MYSYSVLQKKGKFVIAEEHIVLRKQKEKVIKWNMQN